MIKHTSNDEMWVNISAKYQRKKIQNIETRKKLQKAIEEARKRISKTQ
ncbi:hypothetical protein KCM76_23795 [Zooshikella marina]|nr:hypothetical protein [Zooshikella ganghwensis]MBU2709040.1 hypothetical protein [Zooshikella ganghwensis]